MCNSRTHLQSAILRIVCTAMLCILGVVSPDFVKSSGSKRSTLLATSVEDTLHELLEIVTITLKFWCNLISNKKKNTKPEGVRRERFLPVCGEFGEENPDKLRRQTVHAKNLVPESPM